MIKYAPLALLMVVSFGTLAQQPLRIAGAVMDSTENSTLPGVNVVIRNLRDTTIFRGTTTDLEGKFEIRGLRPGRYLLRLSYTGYTSREKRLLLRQDIDLGTLKMSPSLTTLKGVEIEGTAVRVEQKEDTIQYNAGAFKTNPDATAEDLIKKMPGITVDETGVKAQGENVRQILLDGKKFFGDDPNIALRNLPAEIIDKVEVFDQLSEQSQFTGFDDGDTQKTINIRTKRGMSNGQFGNLYGGAGENDHYIASGNYNSFNGSRKVTLLGLSNNINQQNFSTDDLLGVTGSGGGGRGRRGGGGRGSGERGGGQFGGGAGNFLLGQQSGVATTHSGGVNYINEWGSKVELSGSYFFNTADNKRITDLSRNYVSRDSGMTYRENGNTRSTNTNHRLHFRLRYDFDSANSIIVTPRLSMQLNNSSAVTGSFSSIGEVRTNQLDKINSADLSGFNFSNNIVYRHRFSKPGRSFSWRLGMDMNDRDRNKSLQSVNEYFDEGLSSVLDQHSTELTYNHSYSSNMAYTERLGQHGQLQLNYEASLTKSDSDKKTYDLDGETDDYTDLNTELSNVFRNNYVTHQGGLSYRYNVQRKYNFMAGVHIQDAHLSSDQDFPTALQVERSFQSILPNASVNYRFSRDANLRIFYRTSTNAPSVTQLQNVVDNSNPLFLRSGNPNLDQDYEQMLTLRYGKTNAAKAHTFLFFLYGRYVKDYIGEATFYNDGGDTTVVNQIPVGPGQQLTYPVNLPENWNARTFVTYGLPVEIIKSNLNFNTAFNYNRSPALINNAMNLAHSYAFSQGIVLSSNISEHIDFTLAYTANYTIVKNSLESSQEADDNYFTHITSLRVVCQPWKGLDLSSNVTNSFFSGLTSEYDQNIWFWNAAVGYKFLKDKSLELELSAFDLLNQNKSINREVTETYIEDSRTNVLTRYFMFTVLYKFREFGG